MSNEVNNLASSFVAMAQAFEKLPVVQGELDTAHTQIEEYAKQVQRLEMRLMDAKEELDNAHAATRKMEVERDHAETMFLETDDKLIRAKNVLSALIGNASDFIRAVEPPKPEPIVEPTPEPGPAIGNAFTEPMEAPQAVDPIAAPSWAAPSSPSTVHADLDVSGENVAYSPQGESVVNPTVAVESAETGNAAISGTASSSENASVQPMTECSNDGSVPSDPMPVTERSSENVSSVSAQPKPYEGLRYAYCPVYVSLIDWLDGGGTEEAYYAR